jgi:hypothetical protein
MSYKVKMSFVDYYQLSGSIQKALRGEIMKALEISYATFFNKVRNDSWSDIEREKINQVYHRHINILVSNLGIC